MAFTEMPDVIITDIGLPDYDGYFLLQSLSDIPGLAGVPVIVLTARDRLTDEWRCREAGANSPWCKSGFVSKKFWSIHRFYS
jgi:two-component system chemotaxis sensor kinase CheA